MSIKISWQICFQQYTCFCQKMDNTVQKLKIRHFCAKSPLKTKIRTKLGNARLNPD